MKKINFKQQKYLLPALVAVPLIALVYFLFQAFGGSKETVAEVPTDQINMNLPEARTKEVGDKMSSMTNRYNSDNAFTEIEAIGVEVETKENLDGYSDDELQDMMAEAQREELERRRMEELQREIDRTTQRLMSENQNYDFQAEIEKAQRMALERQRALLNQPDPEEEKRREAERLAREEAERLALANQPLLVTKADVIETDRFNTIVISSPNDESPLIRAMIDQTTKAHEGTRLRFKLLDDVIVDDVKLLKGTYLYGTVSGFGQQRVMANINNILVGDRFLKVDLSVFDNDGMEGFYVPSSAFRDFMKQAGSGVIGQNIQFNTGYGSYGNSINGENIALQALQNLYQSATNAIGFNIRKNKAKIKYNTIVYLINSREARQY